ERVVPPGAAEIRLACGPAGGGATAVVVTGAAVPMTVPVARPVAIEPVRTAGLAGARAGAVPDNWAATLSGRSAPTPVSTVSPSADVLVVAGRWVSVDAA